MLVGLSFRWKEGAIEYESKYAFVLPAGFFLQSKIRVGKFLCEKRDEMVTGFVVPSLRNSFNR